MKKNIFIALAVLTGFATGYSQAPDISWTKLFSKDTLGAKTGDQDDIRSHYVVETHDRGFALTGHCCCRHCNGDMFVIRTDSAGTIIWTLRSDDSSRNEVANCIQETGDHGFITAGFTQGSSFNMYYVVRIDSIGNTLWAKKYGSSGSGDFANANSIKQTPDGGFIIAGYTFPRASSHSLVYIIRIDANGDTMWSRTFGGTKNDWARDILVTADSGYVVCGATESFGAGGSDVYLLRLDKNGNLAWSKTFGTEANDGGYSICQSLDGGFVVTGYTNDYQDVYLVKTDTNGNAVWTKTIAGDSPDYPLYCVQATADGGIIATGRDDIGEFHTQLIKLNGREK